MSLTKKKVLRVLKWICLLALYVVAGCNIRWVEYRFLGGARVSFTIAPLTAGIICAVLFLAAFKEELEARLYRLDGRLFGGTARYVPRQADIRYENLFVWVALVFGVVFVFIVPPMTAPDETNHFTRALILSHGQFLPTVDSSGVAVGQVPAQLRAFLGKWNAGVSSWGHRVTVGKMQETLFASISASYRPVQVDYPYPYLSFFLYLPQAGGIALGRGLFALAGAGAHYNLYWQMIFARLMNLMCYIAGMSLAIHIVPFFRRTLTFIALMPMSVYIASSCSYDVFLYVCCMLYLSYILKCAYDPGVDEMDGRRLTVLVVLQFCILLGKYVYFPLLFLIFLIPRAKFGGMPKRRILLLTGLPSTVCLAVWMTAYKISTMGLQADPDAPLYKQQALFVLMHPVRYAAMLLYNMYDFLKDWMTGFAGLFGWLNVPLPFAFVLCYILLLAASSLMELMIDRTLLSRRMLALISVACYVLVATAEYVIWTPGLGNGSVGQSTIIGIQGRYFIPFALPVLLLLSNKWSYRTYLVGKMDTAAHRAAPLIVLGSLGFSAFYLLYCYWLPF